jgi:mannose-1-phosphate guanylyltransferase/mannose-6-phosphate isomerase
MNIVLMAGGGGTRLWPLSRQKQPKQFLALDGRQTLLEQTYNRAAALTKPENIYVATMAEYAPKIRQLLPNITEDHIFVEPERRDNAAAFVAVSLQLEMAGKGDEPASFFWCDHVFTAEEQFLTDIKKIPSLLKQYPDSIAIAGHIPTYPETGFGYIEAGELVSGYQDVFQVKQFKEKPDKATAEQYILAGNYYWNIGAVSARPVYLLTELIKYQPAFIPGVEALRTALESGDKTSIATAYTQLPKTSIDYAVLEHTPTIMVVTGDYGWSDVGNWATVKEIFGTDGDHAPLGHHVHVDSENNYVYNTTNKVVSLIGQKNTIVVVTDDAVLITDKDAAPKVKDVVARLEADQQTDYL